MFHELCQKKIVSIRFQKKERGIAKFWWEDMQLPEQIFPTFLTLFPSFLYGTQLKITDYTLNLKLLSVAFLERKKLSSPGIVLCRPLKIAFKCIYLNQLFWRHFSIPAQHSGFVLSLSCLKYFPEREIADRSLNTCKLWYKIKNKLKLIIIFNFQTQGY